MSRGARAGHRFGPCNSDAPNEFSGITAALPAGGTSVSRDTTTTTTSNHPPPQSTTTESSSPITTIPCPCAVRNHTRTLLDAVT
ncbi:hypothetical protein E2P81_ATG05083 [Venturia nashicola]|uniref:Uncharacterized protein n=1 Tax=Venturia nashicola TaxID=86259 RepID=A0A4Z1P5M7_9PEZI|nr:hypothetical protein E6O75_ATG05209 [Venturia nashicola]TLD34918.1 hypothetical protein E2P81_ATG05083 [Venturia nashicola]